MWLFVQLLLLHGICQITAHNTYQPRYNQSPRQTYSQLECRVDDPLSCSQAKGEVCVFSNGQYRCECPPGINRLGDGRCKLVNECSQPKLNTCHKDAMCIDKTEGYTCQCNSGFADVSPDRVNKPGRICQRTQNECGAKETYGVDCHGSAACVDTPEGFQCVCQPGYTDISSTYSRLPGRKCVEVVNECLDGTADCSANADCLDRPEGYECRCRSGFVDASPDVAHFPGRICNMPKAPEYYGRPSTPENECADSSTCGPNEECHLDRTGKKVCQCQHGAVKDDNGRCKVFSQCERSRECDPNAQCSNTYNGVQCKCRQGYLDISPDPIRLPGRKCVAVTNECAEGTADCDPLAECVDTQHGYLCRCPSSMTDVSSRYGKQPGRKCAQRHGHHRGGNYCKDKTLNSCDENADCVELPDGYTCKCFTGYIDVSSNANLPPGRVCTLQTTCPAQPTDLVFLIDGSGSIGSYTFQTEVIRFVSEFSDLFDIGPEKTRVSVVQYSDQIRHEFGLGDHSNRAAVHQAMQNIEYLTGLTRTGAAIEHVANEAFSERRGARPRGHVARVCIVITDGRSQDNVTIPSNNARRMDIQLFAVGVTNHVLDSELETIAGSRDKMFHVNGFEDLNTRLRSAIQKVACPKPEAAEPTSGPCDPSTHTGCDRSTNQVCIVQGGRFSCGCPKGFEMHPITKVCGGDICNPEIATSCPDPEICEKTPFGNWRCSCAEGWRDPHTGACKLLPPISTSEDECSPNGNECGPHAKCVKGEGGSFTCECEAGFERNAKSDKCQKPGTCDPSVPDSCDARKREKCLPDSNGLFTCQCPTNYRRHPVTEICLVDECAAGTHDCDANAICTDTDESYICTCKHGFLDISADSARKPGRQCSQQHNECLEKAHNCSVNAICIDLPDGFLCRCKDEFVDVSPNPAAFAGTECKPLIDECATPEANTCHKEALCIDTRDSYKCQCKEGFVDQDELRNPGRNCQKLNQVCESGKHSCDKVNARCVERGAHEYECVCNAGFLDMSPDPNLPGRKCVERVCLDPTKNDCHPAAICTEVAGPEKYTCKCRDGYVDLNPFRKGTECKELVNECLDSSLNDCDPAATCIDKDDGFDCRCPVGTKDTSPDTAKPGRVCFGLVDECRNPQLNNCSRFADCVDKEDGYDCKCKAEYHDSDLEHPGTNCKFIINECMSENLNDCHKHADCIDTLEGYDCKCKAPYADEMPENPGRVCRFNECADPQTNDCDKNADCIDTEDGYVCQCKTGFYDESTDPKGQGRVCIGLSIEQPPQEAEKTTIAPNLFQCGNVYCNRDLNEVCIGGEKCDCKPGESRKSKEDKCENVVEIPIVIRVTDRDGETLHYSSDYGSPSSPNYIEVVDDFIRGLGGAFKKTKFSPKYVSSDVNYITNPKVENSQWDNGLLINGSVRLKPDADKCEVFKELTYAIDEQNKKLSTLKVADDMDKLDPCRAIITGPTTAMQEDEIKGIACGNTFCNIDLGEECVAGRVCTCPKGMKRADANSKCRPVESWNLPLWVVRDKDRELSFSTDLANPQHTYHKELVDRFEKGIAESYKKIPVGSGFVTVEVNDIENPQDRNKSWDHGILYNFTTHFVRGAVSTPSKVFTDLVEYIIHKNNFEVGKEKLFISADQMNPFGACYNSDCGENAVCKETGRGGYTCECPTGFRDLNPAHPGHKCLSFRGVNECESPELNECDVNARCIDLDYLYKCECNSGYSNAAPEGKLPGSVCVIDYCSDVNYCPGNSTCKNGEDQPVCECLPGFVDVRKSERLAEAKLEDNYCLRLTDVDECALGLHNCSAAATCIDKKVGYDCRCNDGFTDGNPSEPGRVCAALLCGQCNGHGDCVHEPNSDKITCSCVDGYSGEFCEVAASKAGLILATILALLFLLLALLCCLWMCARCRCFGGRGMSEGTGSGQEILGSDYYTIPRAKLKPAYGEEMGHDNAGALAAYLDDGASISSDGSLEEVERRVTTDVTTREIRTTTVTDAEGNVHTTQAEILHHAPLDTLETEVEQTAMSSSDHFTHAVAGGAASSRSMMYDEDAVSIGSEEGRAVVDRTSRTNQHHDFNAESGIERRRQEYFTHQDGNEVDYEAVDQGDATVDRNTRASQNHEFFPGDDPRTGTERRRNEFVTSTRSTEVNYK